MNKDIYAYIKEEEVAYQKPIQLIDGWDWCMKDHIRRSFLYKHSQFEEENENRDLRPNKNIVRAILNIQYRTEGFDVKDIELYVNDPDIYWKSFLVKKYHEKWVLENAIDTFIDDVVESFCDYGGTLVRDTDENRPEVIDLRGLAFCNQTNILENPFCIKHRFSPAKLRTMTNWGNEGTSIETLITLCKDEKEIEVYELHGTLPAEWLGVKDNKPISEKKDEQQIQVVAYYQDDKKQERGVTLFRHKEPKLPFKFLARDKVSMRALGWGGIEELFEPQIWTNWSEVKITEMLDAASKTLHKTTDPTFKTRNNLSNVDNNEVLVIQEGKDIGQLDTSPRNLPVFNDAVERWAQHAQQIGAASEGMLGGDLPSGIPFKLFEAKIIEDKSMHRYRQGKIAVFMDEIYRDWILPHIAREITNDHNFLAELSADEMQTISEQIAVNMASKNIKDSVLNTQIPQDKEILKQGIKDKFLKKGNKHFVTIVKGEMKDAPLSVRTNIAGKQKNLAMLTDKLTNVLRQFIATPQIRQDPEMIKLLNVILESSGLSPIMFGSSPVQTPTLPASLKMPQMSQINVAVPA